MSEQQITLHTSLPFHFPTNNPRSSFTDNKPFTNEESVAVKKEKKMPKEIETAGKNRVIGKINKEELNKGLYSIYFGTGTLQCNYKGNDKPLNSSTYKRIVNKEVSTKLLKLSKCRSSTLSFNEAVKKSLSHPIFNKYPTAKYSTKSAGIIEGYAANTLRGLGKYFYM
jgi:hypothetical protein